MSGGPPGAAITNGGTSTLVVGTLPLTGNANTAVTVTQSGCYQPITATVSPSSAATLSPTSLPCVNGNVSGSITSTLNQYGSLFFTLAGSGQTYSYTENIFGFTTLSVNNSNTAITEANPGTLTFSGAGSYGLTVSQQGPSAALSATLSCPGTTAPNYQPGAANPGIGLNSPGNFSASGTGSLPITLVIVTGPTFPTGTTPPTNAGPACQIVAHGAGGDSVTVPLNITTTGITIQGGDRRPEIIPGGRKPR